MIIDPIIHFILLYALGIHTLMCAVVHLWGILTTFDPRGSKREKKFKVLKSHKKQ
jgi:hypothetical protein